MPYIYMSRLPKVPTKDPQISTLPRVPSTNPSLDALRRHPDRFSADWFDQYDRTSKDTQKAYKREMLEAIRKKNKAWTPQGINVLLEQRRKQVASAQRAKSKISEVQSQVQQQRKPLAIPSSVFQECNKLYKEIDDYVGYLKDIEKFPTIDKKYRRRVLDQLERLRSQIKSECMLRGQVPKRSEFFREVEQLLVQMGDEMIEASKRGSTTQTRKGGKLRGKGKTRRRSRHNSVKA